MPRRFAALVLICLVMPAFSTAAEQPATAVVPDAPVVAYYFHRTIRCQTCLTIESLARHDVLTELAAEVESGQLAWRVVDLEEHAHFVEEFGLEGSSLVIARYIDSEVTAWERLDRTWELYDDVDAFDAYVLGAIERFLDAASAEED